VVGLKRTKLHSISNGAGDKRHLFVKPSGARKTLNPLISSNAEFMAAITIITALFARHPMFGCWDVDTANAHTASPWSMALKLIYKGSARFVLSSLRAPISPLFLAFSPLYVTMTNCFDIRMTPRDSGVNGHLGAQGLRAMWSYCQRRGPSYQLAIKRFRFSLCPAQVFDPNFVACTCQIKVLQARTGGLQLSRRETFCLRQGLQCFLKL
jgi:hypothetical protein